MTAKRPLCAHCGKPYGERHTEAQQMMIRGLVDRDQAARFVLTDQG